MDVVQPVRHDVVQRRFKISPHIRVSILVDRERSARVLDEHLHPSDLDLGQLGDRSEDLVRDEVTTASDRWQLNRFLEPHFRYFLARVKKIFEKLLQRSEAGILGVWSKQPDEWLAQPPRGNNRPPLTAFCILGLEKAFRRIQRDFGHH